MRIKNNINPKRSRQRGNKSELEKLILKIRGKTNGTKPKTNKVYCRTTV